MGTLFLLYVLLQACLVKVQKLSGILSLLYVLLQACLIKVPKMCGILSFLAHYKNERHPVLPSMC